jgi:hypothetical protein
LPPPPLLLLLLVVLTVLVVLMLLLAPVDLPLSRVPLPAALPLVVVIFVVVAVAVLVGKSYSASAADRAGDTSLICRVRPDQQTNPRETHTTGLKEKDETYLFGGRLARMPLAAAAATLLAVICKLVL